MSAYLPPGDSPKQIYEAVYRELIAARAEIARLKADNARVRELVRDVMATRDTAVNMHLADTAEYQRLREVINAQAAVIERLTRDKP